MTQDTWLRILRTYQELPDRIFEVDHTSASVIEFIQKLDGDGNGLIDIMERKSIVNLLRSLHMIDDLSLKLLNQILDQLDADQSGAIDFQELGTVKTTLARFANGTKGTDRTLDHIALRAAVSHFKS